MPNTSNVVSCAKLGYNSRMNYFLKELSSGNKVYIAAVAIMGAWCVAIVDAISSAIKPPGLANGLIFRIVIAGTFIGFVVFAIVRFILDKKKREQTKTAEEDASVYEPMKEEQIREILEQNPDFNTHCYQCLHYDHKITGCKKLLSKDIGYSRLKEVRINNKKYCLYWDEALDAVEAG